MREPDLIIGPRDNPYMYRWHLLQWRGWQLALHKIFRSDDDRALHDHRADNLSIILKGWYCELQYERVIVPDSNFGSVYKNVVLGRDRRRFWPYFRKAEKLHRLVVHSDKPVWTLWLRWPPRREWGFWCPNKGWIHWKRFTAEQDYSKPGSTSTVGPGCDG